MNSKIIKSGILAGIAMLGTAIFFGALSNAFFPLLESEYANTNIFRPWSDPRMNMYFISPFLLGIILSFAWHKTHNVFHAESVTKKGIKFGIAYFLIATIPGMLMSYASFQLSLTIVLAWTISGLLEGITAGIVFANRE